MYGIEWLETAFEQMAALVRDRPILQEQFSVDLQRLARDLSQWPLEVGESRPNDRRIGFFGALVVYYRVRESERVVRVISIHLSPRFEA